MQLRFEANQEHQKRAIEAIAGLFDGQPKVDAAFRFRLDTGSAAIANRLDLDEVRLLENLRTVQRNAGLREDDELAVIDEPVQDEVAGLRGRFPNFTVEMETGTGKTYVYIRTAVELFERYGWRKFVVVVPSVAVREGVLATLKSTRDHFRQLYGNVPIRFAAYDSEELTQVRQFALSDCVEFLVMTIDSFNKASNVIVQTPDLLQGEMPLHLIQATRPVLLLDEPQNMESEKSVAALASLLPLCALRYSATHRNPYNLVYRLTPADAYRQGLVKRMEVASLVEEDNHNDVFVKVVEIRTSSTKWPVARVRLHVQSKSGRIEEKEVTINGKDHLEAKSNRPEYAKWGVEEINLASQFVRFTNQVELRAGEERGADREAVFRAQIRYAVKEHLLKQARLRKDGIKVLSLFFVDRVASYTDENGLVRRLFDEAFDELKKDYPEWNDRKAAEVRAAYFAAKKTKEGELFVDTRTGRSKEDEAAYDLILRKKEELLLFSSPVAFIFSHTALSEGWDNPNVFQICTLKQTLSDMRKRQEVGRGVRLCVNQDGERVRDERANVLTVVANESYERYVDTLQKELVAEYGEDGAPPKPPRSTDRVTLRLNKKVQVSPEFKALWDRISRKTRYSVAVDSEALLKDAVAELTALEIPVPRIMASKAQVAYEDDGISTVVAASSREVAGVRARRWTMPDIVASVSHLLATSSPPIRLSRKTMRALVADENAAKGAQVNAHEFARQAARVLRTKLNEQLIAGVKYEKLDDWYEMLKIEELDAQEIISSGIMPVNPDGAALFDHIECDSNVEREFVKKVETMKQVVVYFKLPGWFVVPTPVGNYNPDWAIVWQDVDEHGEPLPSARKLYLVRETKGSLFAHELRPDEVDKIACGDAHFNAALGVDYKVILNAQQLPDKGTPRAT